MGTRRRQGGMAKSPPDPNEYGQIGNYIYKMSILL